MSQNIVMYWVSICNAYGPCYLGQSGVAVRYGGRSQYFYNHHALFWEQVGWSQPGRVIAGANVLWRRLCCDSAATAAFSDYTTTVPPFGSFFFIVFTDCRNLLLTACTAYRSVALSARRSFYRLPLLPLTIFRFYRLPLLGFMLLPPTDVTAHIFVPFTTWRF